MPGSIRRDVCMPAWAERVTWHRCTWALRAGRGSGLRGTRGRGHLGIVGVHPVPAVGEQVDGVAQLADAGLVAAAPAESAPLRAHKAHADAILHSTRKHLNASKRL